MASSAINGFDVTATTVPVGSYFGFDFWTGTEFQTVKILSQNLGLALSQNYANTNLKLTGNRSHDHDEYDVFWGKVKTFRAEASIAPTGSNGSYNFKSFGTTASDKGFVISSQLSTTLETYGNNSARFFSEVGFNGLSPTTGYGVISTGSIAGLRGQGAVYGVIGDGVLAGFYGVSSGGYAFQAQTVTGIGVFASASGTGMAVHMDGRSYVEEYGLGAGMASTAIFQVNSTTRGFLPPRMTDAQRLAIVSPAIGLMVYVTDSTEGLYINKSTGWTLIS